MTQRHDAMISGRGLEPQFFAAHAWCINPVLSLRDLVLHLRETWERLLAASPSSPEWEEHRTNVYLLACALDCTSGDYLSYRPFRTGTAVQRSLAGQGKAGAVFALNAPYALRTAGERAQIRAWRTALVGCVEAACRALLPPSGAGCDSLSDLRRLIPAVLGGRLPDGPADWPMRIPEAFRCQDLTHHDVIAMADLFADAAASEPGRPVFVVGPRTAGSYFVPLVNAVLERRGIPSLGWITIRPKEGLSRAERTRLAGIASSSARMVIVDDHPNTGHTFTLLVKLLRGMGARPENMTILAPDHPAQFDWPPLVRPVPVITLAPSAFHKARILDDDARLLDCMREVLGGDAGGALQVGSTEALDGINSHLAARYGDSFQVRLKRVFELTRTSPGKEPARSVVLAKSVGWGWLGYHAYLAATRLPGFVPRLLGLRDGLLFIEWVGEEKWPTLPAAPETIAAAVPSYLAARTGALALERDPTLAIRGYRRTGRDRIADALLGPFGSVTGRLAKPVLRRRLLSLAPPQPTLVDGRMAVENWIEHSGGIRKVDFEHHNFGGGEQDIVDPAYDLASAVYELGLAPEAEERMIDEYAHRSGDADVRERLLPFKFLVGLLAMDRAAYFLQRPLPPENHLAANRSYLAARNFLTYQLNRHHAARIPAPALPAWTASVFLLDLDGVFDVQKLGFFPHTTISGLRAIRSLQGHGFSVLPSTGRSVEHVLDYCRSYGLPGAIAEYGCVFVDNIAGREQILVSEEQARQLARCRSELEKLPGMHTDPGYRVAIHAYRYRGGRWVGLAHAKVEEFLRAHGLDALESVHTDADFYVVPKGVNKGSALSALRERLAPGTFFAAIGDSVADLEMLQRADRAFVPANAASALLASVRSLPHARVARQPSQKGLLEAAGELLRERASPGVPGLDANAMTGSHDGLFDWVLDTYDQPRLSRWVQLLRTSAVCRLRPRPANPSPRGSSRPRAQTVAAPPGFGSGAPEKDA
jgi:hydroxymethylpyrimidine pyrophosphatase-like HAD family hydrolase